MNRVANIFVLAFIRQIKSRIGDNLDPEQTAPAALPVSAADFRTRLAQNKGPAIVNWGRGEEPAARRVTLLGLGNQ
jgi:hypothetical protein